MKKIIAYEALDGSLHRTEEAANRMDEATLIAPLALELAKLNARAKAAGLPEHFGLLAFIKENWHALLPFFPKEARK